MAAAVDSSRSAADAADMRSEIDNLTEAITRIEELVHGLSRTVGGRDQNGLAATIEYAAQRCDELRQMVHNLSTRIDNLSTGTDNLSTRIDNLSTGTDNLSTRIDGAAVASETAAARNDRLQIGADALRIEQQSLTDTFTRRFDEATATLQAVLARSGQAVDLAGHLMTRADQLVQCSTISLGSEVLMRIPEGLLLVPAEDSILVTAVWECRGRLEPGTMTVILALLTAGDCVVDVGANIGLVTLPAAHAVGATGHVIAVEPASRIAGLLEKSISLNFGSGRVTLHRRAAGEKTGEGVLHFGRVAGHSSLLPLPESSRSEEVEVVPLDDLVEPSRRIRLVKIDVEGFELSVWRGMRRILEDNPDLAVVVEFGPEHLRRAEVTVDEWLGAFLSAGFSIYEIDEIGGRLKPLRAREELDRVASLNLLLLRQSPSAYPALEFA